tara:strand:+ start:718 stop:1272 length:555 start_codon:yes stop_codon:yes gene_type:complete
MTSTNSLLDPKRDYYILKEKMWDWGSGDIYDKKGNTIGKMKRKVLSLRSKITVHDFDNKEILTVNRKLASVRKTYEIKDMDEKLLGRTNKKIMSFIRPKMWMENTDGEKQLIGQGSFAGWNFDITDPKGNKVAEVSKADRWRDVFLSGIFDYSDTYAIHILDSTYDRRIILGLVIAIDNSVHDK